MDVISRINELLKARGWSIYRLACEANLTASTVYSIMDGTNQPTITTIESLCIALDISLSEFFNCNIIMKPDEIIVVSKYRKLNSRDKKIIKGLITTLQNLK